MSNEEHKDAWIEQELKKYDEAVSEARELFESRARKYGQSYKVLDLSSCIDLVRMKLYRMKSDNVGYKMEDEILDILNYAVIMMILHDRNRQRQTSKDEPMKMMEINEQTYGVNVTDLDLVCLTCGNKIQNIDRFDGDAWNDDGLLKCCKCENYSIATREKEESVPE